MAIGRLAERAGVSVETIRYYQRRGLLAQPDKPAYGQRRYAPQAVSRVRFVKRAQALGFTLDEIAGLLEFEQARACNATRELAARKLELIEDKLADLTAMRQALAGLMRECDAGSAAGGCPIIHALATD